jgi:hypothetical protein
MAVGKAEFAAFVEMALETGFGRFAGVDDCTLCTAGIDVLAAGTVAAFAAGAFAVFALDHQAGVAGVVKSIDDFLVALCAFFITHDFCSWDMGWCHHRAIDHRTRNKEHCPQGDASENECILPPTTRMFAHGDR